MYLTKTAKNICKLTAILYDYLPKLQHLQPNQAEHRSRPVFTHWPKTGILLDLELGLPGNADTNCSNEAKQADREDKHIQRQCLTGSVTGICDEDHAGY